MKLKPLFFAAGLWMAFMAVPAHAKEACENQRITVFGDSLVAGYGLNPGEAFPEQLARALTQDGHDVTVINAGVSGDTSTGGLARLDWSLNEETDAVILELGANDALRGIPPEVTRRNLDAMIEKLKARDLPVVLAGMLAPPNMGTSYGNAFNTIYPDLADKHDTMLYPFFLDGVAAEKELNQADGIHPTKDGIAVMVKKFMPTAQKLLMKLCG